MREDPFIPKESEIKDSDETTETKENIEQKSQEAQQMPQQMPSKIEVLEL